jgi:hypothetical protein
MEVRSAPRARRLSCLSELLAALDQLVPRTSGALIKLLLCPTIPQPSFSTCLLPHSYLRAYQSCLDTLFAFLSRSSVRRIPFISDIERTRVIYPRYQGPRIFLERVGIKELYP